MTDYIAHRDLITAQAENAPLYENTGGYQFYFDAGGLNLGFGLDITTNDFAKTIEPAFTAAKVKFSQAQLDYIEQQASAHPASFYKNMTHAQLSALSASFNAQLAVIAASDTQANPTAPPDPTSITQSQGYDMMNYYYNHVVTPALKINISNFDSLPAYTQAALETMFYNGPGTLGPITYGAANNYIPGNGSLAVIAEQLAFAANSKTNSNESGLEERYLGSALLAMGVIPTYDAQNVITSVDASGANTQDVINFLEAAVANPIIGSGGISAVDYVSKWGLDPLESYNNMVAGLSQYLTTQNYFVPTATDYNPTGNTTLTGNANPDTYVFTPGDGADTITNFSTFKYDVLRFDGGVSLTGLSGSDKVDSLTISYGSGDSVTLDAFFLRTSPIATTMENNTPVSIYNINVEQGNQAPQTETVILSGTSVIMIPGATYGTDFVVPDNDVATLVGTGSSNTVDLSTATGNIDVNTFTGTITGGDPINDKIYNIQNVIGDAGDDTVTGDNINFTAQSGTTSVVNGTGNTAALGNNDQLTISAGPNETSFQDTINAGSGAATNTINFEGQSIAGSISSGSTDADGRRYDLQGTTLTIQKGFDSLTIDNFKSGDYGINLGYNFQFINPPSGGYATGINDSGTIVGTNGAVVFTDNSGSFANVASFSNPSPGLTGITYASISNSGAITYMEGNTGFGYTGFSGEGYEGFLVGNASANSYFSNFGFTPVAINSNNEVIGAYGGVGGPIPVPSATVLNTSTLIPEENVVIPSGSNALLPTGINDSGVVVGYNYTNNFNNGGFSFNTNMDMGVAEGFVDNHGVYTTVIDPNAGYTLLDGYYPAGGTYVSGINNLGVIVGFYSDNSGRYHGFIDNGGVFTTVDEPGGYNTFITGINDAGDIVGISGSRTFEATPQTFNQTISQSNSTVTVAGSSNATVTGAGNTVNLGASASVTVLANNTTVNGIVGDYITVKNSGYNHLYIAPSDPVSIINGTHNVTDISGSAVDAKDDLSSSANTFTIESTSRGDNIILGGTGDTVNDSGSGNTITIADGGGNDTINGGTTADTFVIGANTSGNTINNFNQTDTLSFSDPSVMANNLTTSRSGNDLILSTGVTLAGFFNNFTGNSASLNLSFVGSGATTASVSSTGQIIPQGSTYVPPVAETDNINANNQGTVSGNVLANNGNGPDTDPNGLSLSVQPETLTTKTGGTFVLNADGSFTYTALLGFRGSDSVTYTLEDSAGLSSTGTVNISNIFTDRAPVTQTETINANEKGTVSGNVLADDSDPDGDPLSALPQTITTANGGTVTISANGQFTYTALLGFRGNDSFTYTAEDPYGLGTVGTVDLNNVFTDRPPVAVADSYTAAYGQTITGNVLANDYDPDNDPMHVVQSTVTTADGFTINLNPNGSFSYAPEAGFLGTDSFTYTVADPYGLTSSATVTLDVTAPPDSIVGTAGNDTLTGTAQDNILFGLNGNDTLIGGPTADTMYGGKGNDTYIVNNVNDVIVENPGEGTDSVFSSVSYTLPANVENITLTGHRNINATGNTESNIITGNSGNNILNDGGAGGADTMIGGKGNDTYIVNNSGDKIIESAHGGFDKVLSSVSYTLSANIEELKLTGTANINATGNGQGSILIGNSGNNILNDGGPLPTTHGHDDCRDEERGRNIMIGGAGNDTYIVNNKNDVIIEKKNGGTDTVVSSVSWRLGQNLENLTLTGTANLTATGNSENNVIIGNSGNNIIDGEGGNNTLTGGGGADTFVMQASEAYHGIDTITDFNVQQGDKLKILGIRDFHSFEDHGHHNDCYNSHHATLADYVRITTSGNNSIVSVDANGRGNDFTQIAVLQNVTGLSASALVNSGNLLLQ